MSRPLLTVALVVFAIAALLPVGLMLARVEAADLAGLTDARTLSLLGRTLYLGLAVALCALLVGLPFGFLVARTDVPGAGLLRALGVLPLLLPPLFIAMTWDPMTSLVGAPAAIAALSLATFPLVALMSARAFERIDGRREEAALLAGGLGAVIRMELPLVLPGALCGACLAFVFAVNDFAVPDYVSAMTVKFNVYADEIFLNWNQTQRPGLAVASALPLIALSLAALLPALALRRRGALATLGGDFVRPQRLRLGPWRWAGLRLRARPRRPGLPRAARAHGLRGLRRRVDGARRAPRRLHQAFSDALDRSRGDVANSLLYSAAAATIAVPLGLVLGHAIERARRVGRLLEVLALLPLAAPAVLFGIGMIAAWNNPWSADFYDSGALVVLLLVGRYATFAILVLSGAVAALHPALEESARMAGAKPATRLGRVVAPVAPARPGRRLGPGLHLLDARDRRRDPDPRRQPHGDLPRLQCRPLRTRSLRLRPMLAARVRHRAPRAPVDRLRAREAGDAAVTAAAIELSGAAVEAGGTRILGPARPLGRGGRARPARRPLGLGQDDAAADRRRAGDAERGNRRALRHDRLRGQAPGRPPRAPRRRLPVPGRRPVAATCPRARRSTSC